MPLSSTGRSTSGKAETHRPPGRRRYQVHRTLTANTVESPWLQNAGELETWLRGRGHLLGQEWETELQPGETLDAVEQVRCGNWRRYRYTLGYFTALSSWLKDGKELVDWLAQQRARAAREQDVLRIKHAIFADVTASFEKKVDVPSVGEEVQNAIPESESGSGPCPKCGAGSGNDWSQCDGACPMPMSPHHQPTTPAADVVVDAETGELIPREINGFVIHQRAKDGYVNATAMCKAAGKRLGNWSQNADTEKVIEAISRSAGIPADLLMDTIVTGRNEQRGTWVHPKVALHLATWCSADFYAQVINWVHDWLTTGKVTTAPAVDFSDPLTTAKLYIEAEEGKRLALAQLVDTRLTLDATSHELVKAKANLDVKEEQVGCGRDREAGGGTQSGSHGSRCGLGGRIQDPLRVAEGGVWYHWRRPSPCAR